MIKAVFFDLGKVLVDFDWRLAAQKIADRSERPFDEIVYTCTGSDLAHQYEHGLIPTEKFLPALKQALRFKDDTESLAYLWSDIFTPIDAHIRILETLSKTHFTGLISNTNPLHVQWVQQQFNFFRHFQRCIVSYEAGSRKPDTAIFKTASDGLGFSADEIVFIDDLERNLSGAQALGWHTIHLAAGKVLEKELAAFL